jgi:hypothetical protein
MSVLIWVFIGFDFIKALLKPCHNRIPTLLKTFFSYTSAHESTWVYPGPGTRVHPEDPGADVALKRGHAWTRGGGGGIRHYTLVFNTWFLGRKENVDFFGFGGPGGTPTRRFPAGPKTMY